MRKEKDSNARSLEPPIAKPEAEPLKMLVEVSTNTDCTCYHY